MRPKTGSLWMVACLSGLLVASAWMAPCALGAPGVLTTVPFPGYGVYVTSVAVNPDTGRIYVVDSYNNDLIVVSGDNHQEVTRVSIGASPTGGLIKWKYVGVDPVSGMVYVTNSEDNTVRVVDAGTNAPVTSISLPSTPRALAVNPVTHRIYVATSNSVTVIDGAGNTVVTDISIPTSPQGITVNPVTNRVYLVVDGSDRSLNVIDGSTNKVTTTVNLGITSHRVAVNPVTNRIYTANNATAALYMINGTNNAVMGQLPVGRYPEGIAVDPLGKRIYVALNTDYNFQVLEGTGGTVVATVPVGLPSRGVAANPNLDRAYIIQYPNILVVIQDDPVPDCSADADCNDGNPCTDDTCENPGTSTASCLHTNNTAPCDDGDVCTQPDACQNGACAGTPVLDCGPVRIDGPNGGEILPTDSDVLIHWHAPATAAKFDLQYSINNGSTWKPIATGIVGRSYDWTVPALTANTLKGKVRVIARTASNAKAGVDPSDAPFTIEVMRLDSPNGGESLTSGATATIRWTTNATVRPVAKTKVLYSINGGSSWKAITTLNGNPGTLDWTVLTVTAAKTNCKVRVILQDQAGATLGKDDSNLKFTVNP